MIRKQKQREKRTEKDRERRKKSKQKKKKTRTKREKKQTFFFLPLFFLLPFTTAMSGSSGWKFSVTIPSWTTTTLESDEPVVVRRSCSSFLEKC